MDIQVWVGASSLLALSSMAGTALAWRYALHRQLLDQPGGRRLHARPTVRGAGIAAMLVFLLALPAGASWLALPPGSWLPLAIGLLALVLVGYADDHASVSARWRLLVQVLASGLLIWSLLPVPLPTALVALAGTVWLVNLYNFIDGSDSFAAAHAIVLGLVVAICAWQIGDVWLAWLGLALASVLLGFLPFNWPPARAFMGDVASGPIGYLAAMLLLLGWREGSVDPLLPLALLSGLITDATLTLLLRIGAGRRWYRPHRTHLYQWLRRCGLSALQVCGLYLVWALVATLCLWLWPVQWGAAPVAFALIYGSAALLWWRVRRNLLQGRRRNCLA